MVVFLFTLSAPLPARLFDSPSFLQSSNIGFLWHEEAGFRGVYVIVWLGRAGWLLHGFLSSDRPGHGVWRGGGVLWLIRVAERAGAAEAAAQRPPVVLALPA